MMQLTKPAKRGLLVFGIIFAASVAQVNAASARSVAWTVRAVAQPSTFSPAGPNRYQILVSNTGGEASSESPVVTDRLPKGLKMTEFSGEEWTCSQVEETLGQWVATCTQPEAIAPSRYAQVLFVGVSNPEGKLGEVLNNEVLVNGGGATRSGVSRIGTPSGLGPPAFGLTDFSMEANSENGEGEAQAGGHPWQLTTSFGIPWVYSPAGTESLFTPEENLKRVSVEVPLGMVGNPFAAEKCPQTKLRASAVTACPPGSQIGTIAIAGGFVEQAQFFYTGGPGLQASGIYNMETEPGYPAEFGFAFDRQTIYLYATVVHSPQGERLRLTTIGAPPIAETGDVVVTLWGDPRFYNGSVSTGALITDPVDCADGPGIARIEIESWARPGHVVSRETTVFPHQSGCGLLQPLFSPALDVAPASGEEGGTTKADSPSGFAGSLTLPQSTSFEARQTPEPRDVTVALPAGVSINPAAGQGLVGCKATGPEGINLGTASIGVAGKDEGNPESTELGAGHVGGNDSLYNDDQYHTAPGHCPQASTIGTVEVTSPLVAQPLKGHVFIAQPECGAAGLRPCVEADAENGSLFAGYVELTGDGVLVKERGTLSVNRVTGQMTLHLSELPQLPFSSFKLKVQGGEHAPLETPQVCGSASTMSSFVPWSGSEAVSPTPSAFTVDADGAGGACPGTWPFSPGFAANSASAKAGGFTPFTTTLTRGDREQNVTGLSVSPPLGLLAMLASVTRCPEASASSGMCPASSLIGHDTAGAGSGTEPLYVSGKVYLTGPYRGAPFGLAVVTPAVAGPFNLGNIVVRAAIEVNPHTARVTIVSDPIPQSWFGIPLRLKALNVTIDREGFVFNPTSCAQQQVTATATGNQGANAGVSSPFAVAGCRNLPFKPKFTAATYHQASKASGASLDVKLVPPHEGPQTSSGSGNSGSGSSGTVSSAAEEANIARVKVDLPKILPSRLTTLQKACTAAVFDSNPANCPAGSIVGSAVAHTPLLSNPVSGPAYFVSHGNEAFPQLVVVLQGEGITVDLVGDTFISKAGITSSTFAHVPDVPVTSFELTLPEGKYSALAANADLCKNSKKLTMPTEFVGQNGAKINETTKISVTGCPKAKKATIKSKKRKKSRKH